MKKHAILFCLPVVLVMMFGCSKQVDKPDITVSIEQQQIDQLRKEVDDLKEKIEANPEPVVVPVTADPIEHSPVVAVLPSDIEYDRFIGSLEALAFDDRETAKAVYEKITTNVLSLSDDDVRYSVSGNGHIALQVPFSTKLRERISQGVPESHWSQLERVQNGGFGSAIGATVRLCQRLKLEEPFDVVIAAKICSKPDVESLWELTEDSKRLIERKPSEVGSITGHELEYFKSQRLLRPLLNEYLEWVKNRTQN